MALPTSDTTAQDLPNVREHKAAPPNPDDELAISVESLHAGSELEQDLYDAATDLLLLARGLKLTPRFLSLLASRGIKMVRLKPTVSEESSADPLESPHTRTLDALLEKELTKKIPFRRLSVSERPRLGLSDLKAEVQRGLEHHLTASITIEEVCQALSRGRTVSGSAISDVMDLFANQAASDIDLLPLILNIQKSEDEYLYDHCINVALLSMSVASSAGLPREQIKEIGFGAAMQDIGMLRVPQELRLAKRVLTDDEFLEIRRHPIFSLDWLERIGSVPLVARFIIYQSHERVDQSGYPRRRDSKSVHQFSKVVGVADSFAAMTRPRPYRPARLPYEATRTILFEVGKFERSTVRMFLDTVGLFPPGSYVELHNGTKCRVVRANPGYHTRPLVEELDENDKPTGRHLDLSQMDEVHVARAIPDPQEPCGTASPIRATSGIDDPSRHRRP
ncbi:MAG: hypothetical protein IIC51_10250 [Planctomycetes bacterium]|nr:hypothetical protein [Planctomycetota bacterium]